MPKNTQNYHTIALISHTRKVMLKILQAKASAVCEPRTFRCTSWIYKRQRNQRSNCQHSLDHRKSKRIPEKTSISASLIMPKLLTVWITTNCRILKEMGISDHLTCLLRNLHAGQEVTVRTRHGTMTCSKLGQEYVKAVYRHPAYLTSVQSTSCEMLSWMKYKVESRFLREISIISDMQMTSPLWQKEKRN